MSQSIGVPFGVCVWPAPPRNHARTVQYANYIHEILGHAGLCYERIEPETLAEALPDLRLLLTVGETRPPDAVQAALAAWVEAGGAWISVGGVCGLEDQFGVTVEAPEYKGWGSTVSSLGEGYLQPSAPEHPLLAHLTMPLHYFNGLPVRTPEHRNARLLACALDAHQRPTERALVVERITGRGRCLLLAPDITGTIVRIQQGTAISRDGVSAPDGSAPVADSWLKSDDGQALDWHFDRQPVPDVEGLRAFLQPIADQWRELLLRAIFYFAERQRIALPLLWFYPRNLTALAHLSHDTDGNDPNDARTLLEAVGRAEIHSTWCVILPGYAPELIADIRAAGHELAMHYDAIDYPWDGGQFARQYRELTALFDGEAPVSNKNHFLRWEGDVEFYDWCAASGIRLDQTKGASKTGEAGYNFGTCHLYFPVRPNGEPLDVLELATPTQDLNVFAPAALLTPLLETVTRHYGVLHLLFHPAHMRKPGLPDTLVAAVETAKAQGLEWWTGRELNTWERARRQALWSGYRETADGAEVTLRTLEPLPGATVLWLRPSGAADSPGMVTRWGFRFQSTVFEAATEAETRLKL